MIIKLQSIINQFKPKINPKIIYVKSGSVEAGNVVGKTLSTREGKDEKEYEGTILLSLKVQRRPSCQT